MTIDQIKAAVDAGAFVCWMHEGYRVIRDRLGQYLIIHACNQCSWGLTDRSGRTLNGLESEFFIRTEGT